jgi:hypothetical protein
MRTSIVLLGGALLLAACNQGGSADTKSTQPEAPPKPKVSHYCFYKPDAQKDWSAHRDADGNIVVKGKAHLDDNRYKATLGKPEFRVGGRGATPQSAKLWLSMTDNTSYASPGNWWDVTFTIPDSASVGEVTVNCDAERQFADLKVAPAKTRPAG